MFENHLPSSNVADSTSDANAEDAYSELLRQMQSSLMESDDDFESDFDAPMPTLLSDENDAHEAVHVSKREEVEVSSEGVTNENAADDGWSMPEFPAYEEFANEFHEANKDFNQDSTSISTPEAMPASFTQEIETEWVETSNELRKDSSETSNDANIAQDFAAEGSVENDFVESYAAENDLSNINPHAEAVDVEVQKANIYFDDSDETESASQESSESSASDENDFQDVDDFDINEMPEMPEYLMQQSFETTEFDEKPNASNIVASQEQSENYDDFVDSLNSFSMPQILEENQFAPTENLTLPENNFVAYETSTATEAEESFVEPDFTEKISEAKVEPETVKDEESVDEHKFNSDAESLENIFGDVEKANDFANVSTDNVNVNLPETSFDILESSETLLEVAEANQTPALSNENAVHEVVDEKQVSHFDEIENLVDDAQPSVDEDLNVDVLPNEPRSDLAKFSFADEETLMSFLDNLDRNSFTSNPEPLAAMQLTPAAVSVNLDEKHIVFKLEESLFAFSAADVLEIAHPLKVTPLPFVPAWLTGVTNLRGDILAVVDLRRLWNKQPATHGANKTKMLVLRSRKENLMMGLIVDSVREMCVLPDESASVSLEQIESVNNFCDGYLQGAKNFDNNPVWVLDAENFLAMAQNKANC